MAAKIFYQEDCDLSLLDGKKLRLSDTVARAMLMH